MPYRAALVMTDALAGHTDAVVEELTLATGGNYSFFGGGAGDDGRFQKTHVFAGTEAVSDAVVALEMLSMQPIGVGVSHGWVPAEPGLRVTEADGMRLVSLNGAPAQQAFEDHAGPPARRSTWPTRCRSSCTTSSASRAAATTACACRWGSTPTARSPARRRFPRARSCTS